MSHGYVKDEAGELLERVEPGAAEPPEEPAAPAADGAPRRGPFTGLLETWEEAE